MQHSKQQSAKDKNKDIAYLTLKSEPEDTIWEDPSFSLKEELFSNRYFLKHRVWRNMKKMRQQPVSPAKESAHYTE